MLALPLQLLLATTVPDAGADGGVDVSSWRLSMKAKKGEGLRAELVAEMSKGYRLDGGMKVVNGELPLSREEAEALFDDPRSELIYGEKTVSIVAPSMPKRHRQEHIDLMNRFLVPERIDAGVVFSLEHKKALEATQALTGVDPDVIVGILMWESKLGTITGDYRAFNSFASQLFFLDDANAVALSKAGERAVMSPEAHAKRVASIRDRARKNLVALVRQCKAKGIDPLEVKGSWAGALGFPQFMPASLRWAADGDGDGKIDLYQMHDAIASVGAYLKAHGFAQSREKAVFGYNHEQAYVQGVLAFADALKKAAGKASAP